MSLDKLIKPQSIAIVGVTEKPGFGRNAGLSAAKSKNKDRVYYINPKRAVFEGMKCYGSLTELPEVVDCVVICTASKIVPLVLEEAGGLGVGAAIVYASGFAEEGTEEGIELENRLNRIAKQYDMKLLGPNCMGAINNVDKINMWAGHTHWDLEDESRGIAIIAQSGFIAAEILNTDFFNISYGLSTGNGNIVSLEEYFEYVVEDEYVDVISIYLEGIKDADRFLKTLKRAQELSKPVVVLKSGRSVKGALSAASHTGSLAGSDNAYKSIFKKYGVIVADNLEEFMCLSQALNVLGGSFPQKETFAMISFSGGESTLAADLAEDYNVDFVDLTEESKIEIQKHIPDFAVAKNPLDATTALFRDGNKMIGILKALQEDSAVGSIIVGTNVKKDKDETTALLCNSIATAKKEGVEKPIFAVPSLEGYRYHGSRKILEDAGVPLMSSINTSFSCLNKISEYIKYNFNDHDFNDVFKKVEMEGLNEKALSEFESRLELLDYKVPFPKQMKVSCDDELAEASRVLEFPVVMKINSDEILHKSDVGGVKVNIRNYEEATAAKKTILRNVEEKAASAQHDGILVQEMAPQGLEMIVGISSDAQFGPMLLVGMGGIFVEVFKDVAMCPVPINKKEALEMLEGLQSFKLLNGYRGSEKSDIEALTDLMVSVSQYAQQNRNEIKELDLNPVFVYPEGKGVKAVDALIVKYV
ncbi:Acyl-CoA synthetase (NDP forming) [Dethiosulfatibacter aminovorans DSM 17477]|uniref:Acyl-CoA synthetase (NDP forming) n=1 Tax=Dethiosulfatibacter aminovorans DSM 17477 TaxID=1121476 RepID=A0A1M6J1C5_9FIRM|nr:acetate--CoA ligase family protein [Dethiosulfatibacter aminovorans]SHJ40488.1 Acyl-CoA synthetase (NDP forming) [Dethiosulfatibacter aminovorans DSM 17477]